MSEYEVKMYALQSGQFTTYRYCMYFICVVLVVLCILEWKNRR